LLRGALLHLLFRFSRRQRVHGIDLVVAGDETEVQLFFTKIREALEIIRTNDLHRWACVQRQLRRIVLINDGGQAYHREAIGCVVDLPTLRTQSALEIASTIVHEATHARFQRWGIDYKQSLRTRIETACVREEIAFLKRIPDTDLLIENLRSSLQTPWWTDEAIRERRLRQLRSAGVPQWMLQLYDRIRNFGRRS
jgi:hypothetical protein